MEFYKRTFQLLVFSFFISLGGMISIDAAIEDTGNAQEGSEEGVASAEEQGVVSDGEPDTTSVDISSRNIALEETLTISWTTTGDFSPNNRIGIQEVGSENDASTDSFVSDSYFSPSTSEGDFNLLIDSSFEEGQSYYARYYDDSGNLMARSPSFMVGSVAFADWPDAITCETNEDNFMHFFLWMAGEDGNPVYQSWDNWVKFDQNSREITSTNFVEDGRPVALQSGTNCVEGVDIEELNPYNGPIVDQDFETSAGAWPEAVVCSSGASDFMIFRLFMSDGGNPVYQSWDNWLRFDKESKQITGRNLPGGQKAINSETNCVEGTQLSTLETIDKSGNSLKNDWGNSVACQNNEEFMIFRNWMAGNSGDPAYIGYTDRWLRFDKDTKQINQLSPNFADNNLIPVSEGTDCTQGTAMTTLQSPSLSEEENLPATCGSSPLEADKICAFPDGIDFSNEDVTVISQGDKDTAQSCYDACAEDISQSEQTDMCCHYYPDSSGNEDTLPSNVPGKCLLISSGESLTTKASNEPSDAEKSKFPIFYEAETICTGVMSGSEETSDEEGVTCAAPMNEDRFCHTVEEITSLPPSAIKMNPSGSSYDSSQCADWCSDQGEDFACCGFYAQNDGTRQCAAYKSQFSMRSLDDVSSSTIDESQLLKACAMEIGTNAGGDTGSDDETSTGETSCSEITDENICESRSDCAVEKRWGTKFGFIPWRVFDKCVGAGNTDGTLNFGQPTTCEAGDPKTQVGGQAVDVTDSISGSNSCQQECGDRGAKSWAYLTTDDTCKCGDAPSQTMQVYPNQLIGGECNGEGDDSAGTEKPSLAVETEPQEFTVPSDSSASEQDVFEVRNSGGGSFAPNFYVTHEGSGVPPFVSLFSSITTEGEGEDERLSSYTVGVSTDLESDSLTAEGEFSFEVTMQLGDNNPGGGIIDEVTRTITLTVGDGGNSGEVSVTLDARDVSDSPYDDVFRAQLEWSSTNADSCEFTKGGSNDASTNGQTEGTELVGGGWNDGEEQTYEITCTNAAGNTGSDAVLVRNNNGNAVVSQPSDDACRDSAESTVTQWYNNILQRDPDSAGKNFWIDQLCEKNRPENQAREAFIAASENEFTVQSIYVQLFDRTADWEGLEYWVGQLESGSQSKEKICVSLFYGAGSGDSSSANSRGITSGNINTVCNNEVNYNACDENGCNTNPVSYDG